LPKFDQKQVVVDEIKKKLDGAASVVLIDGRGLTVLQDTALRKTLRTAGVHYKVYKNTLLERAFEGTPFAGLSKFLSGPTTMAVSYGDATAAARLLSKEAKNLQNLKFKAGVVENTVYDEEGIKLVAEIPPRDELLAKLLGSFKSPLASFARLVSQIAEKKGGAAATE